MQQSNKYNQADQKINKPTNKSKSEKQAILTRALHYLYIWEWVHSRPQMFLFSQVIFVYFVKAVIDHHVHNLINECKFWTCIGEQDKRRLLIDMIRKYYIKIEVQKTPLKGCLAILLLTKVQMDVNIVCKFEFSFEEFSFPQYLYFFLFTWHCLPSPWSPQLSGTEQRIVKISKWRGSPSRTK